MNESGNGSWVKLFGSSDINHYQGALYARKNLEKDFFLNGMVSLGYDQYDVDHHIIVNNFNQVNPADFHGWQYAVRGEIGHHCKQENFELQPVFSINYAHINFNHYHETGGSNTAQIIDYDSVNALIAKVGLKILDEFNAQQFKFFREVHVNIGYDLIGDKQKATAQFIDFGPSYEITGFSAARIDYNFGFSLSTDETNGIRVSFGYDYHGKQDYRVHTGYLRLRYEWT